MRWVAWFTGADSIFVQEEDTIGLEIFGGKNLPIVSPFNYATCLVSRLILLVRACACATGLPEI